MSGYGPMASMANMGGTALSGLFSGDIGKYVGQAFDSPMAGKIASVALPMLLSGGIGAALGGKYGWGNAIPSGIMALMAGMGEGEEGAASGPTKQGPGLGEVKAAIDENPSSITNKSLAEAAQATAKPAAQQATQQAAQPAKASTGISGSLGDLMNDPIGRIIMGMVLSNMTSGVLGNASGAEQEYNQKRTQARDAYNKQIGDMNYIRNWYQ